MLLLFKLASRPIGGHSEKTYVLGALDAGGQNGWGCAKLGKRGPSLTPAPISRSSSPSPLPAPDIYQSVASGFTRATHRIIRGPLF